jgi:hypothetical protein
VGLPQSVHAALLATLPCRHAGACNLVSNGILQGSVLITLLFVIFIYDLLDAVVVRLVYTQTIKKLYRRAAADDDMATIRENIERMHEM